MSVDRDNPDKNKDVSRRPKSPKFLNPGDPGYSAAWGRLNPDSPFTKLSFLPPSMCVFAPYKRIPFDQTMPKPQDNKKPRA